MALPPLELFSPKRKSRPVAGRLFRSEIPLGRVDGRRISFFPASAPENPSPFGKLGKKADVAQLVEQLIRNQQVSGSIPLVGSSLRISGNTLSILCKEYS